MEDGMMKPLKLVVGGLVLTASSLLMGNALPQNKTQTTGDLTAPATGGGCNENRCKTDGGCASCLDLTVTLPQGSQVRAIRYYTTAGSHGSEDMGMHEIQPGETDDWAMMEQATQTSDSSAHVIVRAKFYNRSNNRSRQARLEVDYTE
jgi:hypothetical protein